MNMRCPPAEQGFGLIETLIAVAVMAAMAAMTFATVATNARVVRQVEDRRMAALVAQSALDQMVASEPLARQGGTSAGLVWTGTTEPYAAGGAGAPPIELITVSVARPGDRVALLRLRTLRLRR